MRRKPRVIVVGAGIAGLVAAHRLAAADVPVTLLEGADWVGGRMTTETVDGFVIDRGAQFLSRAYCHLPGLVTELGLRGAWRPTSRRVGVVRDGQPRRMHYHNPLSIGTGGLLRPRELVGLGRHFAALRRLVRGRSLTDYGAWAALDDRAPPSGSRKRPSPLLRTTSWGRSRDSPAELLVVLARQTP